MRTSSLGPLAVAAAIAFVGALVVDVPIGPLVVLAVVLACSLMMIFMMTGMRGGGRKNERRDYGRWRDPHSDQ